MLAQGTSRVAVPDSGGVSHQLGEVTVKRKRPIVRVTNDGGLVYDGRQLAKGAPASNVWELLDEVPGVKRGEQGPSIVGAAATTVLINGHQRHVSLGDLKDMLEAIPPSQVKRVEVYYNSPPQFGVSGSSVNIVMDERRSKRLTLGGNGYLAMLHGQKYYQRWGLNLSLAGEKWEAEAGFAMGGTEKYYDNTLNSLHVLTNQITHVSISSHRDSGNSARQFKLKFNGDLGPTDKLYVFYVYKPEKPHLRIGSDTSLDGGEPVSDVTTQATSKGTHMGNVEYRHKDLVVGADYVAFDATRHQTIDRAGTTSYQLRSESRQKARHGNLYLNATAKVGGDKLTYGISSDWWKADNRYRNTWSDGTPKADESTESKQREYAVGAYAGLTHKFGERGTLSATLQVQYFRSTLEHDGEKSTLWNTAYLYPNITYTHVLAPLRKLVVSFNTHRYYPTYSQTSASRTYIDTYRYSYGDPSLKPYTIYEAHANHIVNNRYVMGLYASMQPRRLEQVFYLKPDRLEGCYEWVNTDRSNQFGLLGIVPVQWSGRFSTKLTAKAYYANKKGRVEDVTFNGHRLVAQVTMANNLAIDKGKTLVAQLSADYHTRELLPLCTTTQRLDVGLALTWSPKNTGLYVSLGAYDLLGLTDEEYSVSTGRQHYVLTTTFDSRHVNLTVRYTLKGYKAGKERKIDTSRMGL